MTSVDIGLLSWLMASNMQATAPVLASLLVEPSLTSRTSSELAGALVSQDWYLK